MANKVQFGLSNVYVAFLTVATQVYGTPIPIPGAVKLSLTPEGDETEFYADNIAYFTASANQGYKEDLEMALLPDAVLAEMLGWSVDDNGVLVEVADGTQKPFALLFEAEGDVNKKRYVQYNCLAARPQLEHSTKAKAIDPTTQTLPIVVSPIEIDDVLVIKGSAEPDAAAYAAWFTEVQKPSFTVVS